MVGCVACVLRHAYHPRSHAPFPRVTPRPNTGHSNWPVPRYPGVVVVVAVAVVVAVVVALDKCSYNILQGDPVSVWRALFAATSTRERERESARRPTTTPTAAKHAPFQLAPPLFSRHSLHHNTYTGHITIQQSLSMCLSIYISLSLLDLSTKHLYIIYLNC